MLPSGRKLGYRGNVISFLNDNATVAEKLPRAVADAGVVFFALRGSDKDGKDVQKLKRVRRGAVREWLEFLYEHHELYRSGVRDVDTGDWIVPPWHWEGTAREDCIDEEAIAALPEDGVPDGIPVVEDADETIDDDTAGGRTNDGGDGESGDEGDLVGRELAFGDDDDDGDASGVIRLNSRLISTWLSSSGACAVEARRVLTERGISEVDSWERALNLLHDRPQTEPRGTFLSLGRLAARLRAPGCDVAAETIHAEMGSVVASLGIELDASGLACNYERTARTPEEQAEHALNSVLGSAARPLDPPTTGCIPLSEYKARGYMTLAFPTLFPFGKGHFDDARTHDISYSEWVQHLENFRDGRFANDTRWPYFVQNVHERANACDQAQTFLNTTSARVTVGDLRKLSKKGRNEMFNRVSRFAANIRNSPAFFGERRKELMCMCEQLGDPHVFATNSYADTFCPYLMRYIIKYGNLDNSSTWHARDPFASGISPKEKHSRRSELVRKYPHVCAAFFALKTELYIEHICSGIMGCDAHWCRYEWQSRGSTHVHYFLWLRDAPLLEFLNEWTKEAISDNAEAHSSNEETGYVDIDEVIDDLNARALSAARGDAACACDGNKCECDHRAHAAADWWNRRARQYSDAWDEVNRRPDIDATADHPASVERDVGDAYYRVPANDSTAYDFESLTDGHAPQHLVDDVAECRNKMNRHTVCSSYCLRRCSVSGTQFCRFRFPVQPRDPNIPHFYAEKVKNGIRWKLYLPINDPLMNMVNTWQCASQRSNVDFRPLIDHIAAVEYSTKYASKPEKGSKALDGLIANAMTRSTERGDDESARPLFASFLVQQVGGRDWSAQEVGHVQKGFRTVFASHDFANVSVTTVQKKLRDDIAEDDDDDTRATAESKFDAYLNRVAKLEKHYLAKQTKRQRTSHTQQPTLHAHGVGTVAEPNGVDPEAVKRCSFIEFYRNYRFASGGRGSPGQVLRRQRPTIVVVKPRMPPSWGRPGHEKRAEYCKVRRACSSLLFPARSRPWTRAAGTSTLESLLYVAG